MNRDQKAAVVEEISSQLQGAEAVFAVDYRGISVSQVAELRARLRDADATFRIVKNSLTERAADKAGVAELKELLDGPTALALVSGDPALAAKALNDSARAFQLLEFKGGLLSGNVLTGDQIRSIARLPSREVLHGQLVGTIAAPLSGLVRTLNALIQGLAVQLGQIAEQGLVSGEAPAPAPEEASEAAPPAEEAAPPAESEEAAPASESGGVPETDGEAAASDATDSDADASPEALEPEAPAEPEAAPEAEAEPEAPAAEVPAETAEEPAPAPEAAAEPEASPEPEQAESDETQEES
jgi:large subunit ribosomal protein L10